MTDRHVGELAFLAIIFIMNFDYNEILNILYNTLESWVLGFVASLPNVVAAAIVAVIFWYLAKVVRTSVSHLVLRFSMNVPVAHLLAGVFQGITVLSGFFIALGILNLHKTVTSLLAGAGVVGLAIGFAFQEIASNFLAGVFIAFRKPFKIGDIVKVKGYEGEIHDVDLRTTRIMTVDGMDVMIPNKDMFTSAVTNLTFIPQRRVELDIGVYYGQDLRKARDIALEALKGVEGRVLSLKPEVYYRSIVDSVTTFRALVWIEKSDPTSYLIALNDIILRLKDAFEANAITAAYPVHVEFQIPGRNFHHFDLHQEHPHFPKH